MKCPFCGFVDSKVVDSRPTDDYVSIRRRRECLQCSKRFTTHEHIESLPLMVVKRNGIRVSFDRQKILTSMLRACSKLPISLETLERIAVEIEQNLLNNLDREVQTTQIGDLVMARLKELDQVAYVRFAAVYRKFRDVEDFREELSHLLGTK
ncbi:transcriptional repressor NrdR [Clostridia bacterium]|nr:transcriptional repressor NrdR [Clostridia bacterium]GHV31569.1 transcriptional repressor NrdR [Clostridia bacterium]